ncbi:uncharacterized protein KY384_003208 [Bacidia gigantensis]|uniref:uncharacterized protein n=1 Tax=Bacidia gigantensis TaxID=2732470 RepID=UPI001D048AA0|nr:uncharacterized protein KY384_003208 [Bacidia gigantensis]KAG8531578.1 hypothetical protein KY384_003208 [Bacidia gigantensis]
MRVVSRTSTPLTLTILTKNIRYATDSPFEGEERWEVRRPYLTSELLYHTAHCAESFICLQEVLHDQLNDVLHDLNKDDEWSHIGVGRNDGQKAGEYSPILYRPSVWKLDQWHTTWLSRTPDKPSKGWDAGAPRILTTGTFSHRMTGQKVLANSTHLDERGSRSRLEAAKVILERIRQYAGRNLEIPSFLGGDFNSESHEEAYLEVTSDGSPMADLRDLVPIQKQYGDINTFSGFTLDTRRKRIDFIFLSGANSKSPTNPRNDMTSNEPHGPTNPPEGPWLADGYAVIPNCFEDGVYNSDHQSVVGTVRLSR